MQIQAALLVQPNRHFVVEDVLLEPPRTGEVQVKLAASGVCHSDWHVATGDTRQPMPCVTGHEGAGVVAAVGPGVSRVQVGDHVTLSWAPDCGECFYCLRGQPNLCETFTAPLWRGVLLDGTPRLRRLDGSPVYHYCGLATFADYAVVPETACIPIDRRIPLTVAALVGCAVATGVGAALYTAQVRPGDSVVVYGAGGIGLNILQGAALCGAGPIIAVDTHPAKMALARQFGATHTLLADDHPLAAIQALTGGRGAEHVFESVGLAAVQEAALAAVRPGGMLTLVGLAPMGSGTNLPGALLVRQEKTVKGSYYGSVSPRRDFPLLLSLYQSGRLKLDELISRTYRLDEINQAYADMLSGRVARGVIVFP
ncbi:MAG: Zn-dependent alcohol dehydrogenase [Anaerolineae bacterium]|jgi:NDMA-dependent alcohol dehydrogenase|nr:Zn-dependent alcohol dehydrogenase [Anaerolineae bacterium]